MNINFVEVKGSDIYNNFFDKDHNVKKESDIESEYNFAHIKATTFAVKPIKASCDRGVTDGVMSLGDNIEIIQECKRKILNRNTKAYKYHILQGLCYHVQMPEKQVILLASENYIDYIYMDENKYDKNVFIEALKSDPPSKACKKINIDIDSFIIHRRNMPEASITDIWKEINNHFN